MIQICHLQYSVVEFLKLHCLVSKDKIKVFVLTWSVPYSHCDILNHVDGVIVIVLSLSAVDCGLKPRSGETTDDKIGIRCFSSKHAALRNKSKD